MIPALVLLVLAVAYRLAFGLQGTTEFAGWQNFSPLSAIVLCGAVWLPRRAALVAPLAALFATDLVLNAHYGHALVNGWAVSRYAVFIAIAAMGWRLRGNPAGWRVLLGSVAGSVAFYLVTNSASWLADPGYAKSAAGWVQALTTGLPEYNAPTWMFYRNTFAGDVLFTGLFIVCMARRAAPQGVPALAR